MYEYREKDVLGSFAKERVQKVCTSKGARYERRSWTRWSLNDHCVANVAKHLSMAHLSQGKLTPITWKVPTDW